MLDLRQSRLATSLLTIGFSAGLLACLGNTQASESGAPSNESFEYKFASAERIIAPTTPAEYKIALAAPAEYEIASAAPFEMPRNAPDPRLSEPFGLETSTSITTSLQNDLQVKWKVVIDGLRQEREVFARCRAQADACPPAAAKFLAIVDSAKARAGLARIGEINRAINLAVRWVDDMTQYGVPDLWATPLMTFASNAGNCKDYAVSKYSALQEMGFGTDDLRVVVVRDRPTHQLHAVTAVRYDGRWLILDNRTFFMVQDVDIATYNPLFVMDGEGVKRLLPETTQPKNISVSVNATPVQPFSNASAGAPLLL